MPIAPKYKKVLDAMIKQYGPEKGKSVFYASMKKKGIDYKKDSKETKYFNFGLEFKEEEGEFYSEGFIATSHADRVGDVIPKSTLRKIVDKINSQTGHEAGAASYRHDWIKQDNPDLPLSGKAGRLRG